ncbi:diablo IAP-binding mitochondrial protein-like isoform X1 [Corythoichthys intestinalis]|uniref:diablo IAP-binding mitochondrial protein-like isoform X1 n=1 Tax=Corythoichthys intestinalis TaxID=161448 RepID=UPI0025A511B7|nr:diablo IAP-binding mitochondrial protein-like isoform X1 [Corythoichthys intestinalis]
MQAVRQCSTCAVRTMGQRLGSQRDVPSRRGAACSRLLSSSHSGVLLSTRMTANRRLVQGKECAHTSAAPLSLSHLCSTPSIQQTEHLSHDALIRRATLLLTDGTGTLLSQSTYALVDALEAYTKAVHTRIALQRRYMTSLGKLTSAEEDSLQQAIFEQKAEVNEHLDECKRFETTWIKAVNLCKIAAEVAYASGSEQASVTLTANIQLMQSHADQAQQAAAAVDKKLAETKVDEIQRMAEYVASLEEADELEIQDAYLRED